MIQFNTKEELNDWILNHPNPLELLEVEGADGKDFMDDAGELIRHFILDSDIVDWSYIPTAKKLRANIEHQYLIPEKFIDEGINEANREAERGSYDE